MNRPVVLMVSLAAALMARGYDARAQTEIARRPQVWAIVVGVGSPTDPKLKSLNSRNAVAQANQVRGWFNGTAGWDRSHVLLLTDFGGSDDPGTVRSPAPNITPLKKNLDWAFREWLKQRAKPDDVIVFYFAGQARSVAPKGPSISPENYLLPTDARSESLATSGWSLDKALDAYAKAKYQIVCWLGTSLRSDPVADGGKARIVDAVALSRDWLFRLARWQNVTVWLASDGTPTTAPGDLAVNFTQAVLAGLGKGDHKQNLSGCLAALQQSPNLKGFRSIGGLPPHLNLWADQIGRQEKSPQPEMVLQVGHADGILDIVATPDGRHLITASQDSTIRVWSPAQNALLRVLPGHSVGATALALSESGRWLVSGGGRGEVLVHDLAQGFARKSPARQPHRTESRVVQVAMLPDGAHFVTVDSHARAFIWNLSGSVTAQPWLMDAGCRVVCSGGRGADGVVVALCGDSTLQLFDSAGAGNTLILARVSKPVAISVSPDGHLLATGCADGRVVVRDLKNSRQTERKAADGPVRLLSFASSSRLAVAHDNGVRLFAVKEDLSLGEGNDLFAGRGVEKMTLSRDGALLGVCAKDTGALQVWKLDGDTAQKPVVADPRAGVMALSFASDGRTLITGHKSGSVKTWPLAERGEAAPRTYAAHRGKIKHVATSPSRGFLLMLNDLNQAQLWDLGQRTCRLLPRKWSGGVFLSDDTLIMADRPDDERPGRLVRIDRKTLGPDPDFFARSSGAFKIDPEISFEAVALSPDGTHVAASASPMQPPLVCVWETKGGRLTHWITGGILKDPVAALSFSSDARHLLSAGESPEAKLWDLSRSDGAIGAPAVTFEEPKARNITCVQIQPGSRRQMVTGHSDGRLLLWSWADGNARQVIPRQTLVEQLQFFTLAVHAISFTPDGRYLAAVGDGPMIWLGEMGQQVRQIRNLGSPGQPHHLEQINTLATWAGSTKAMPVGPKLPGNPPNVEPPRPPVLISGSDDTTVKFWDLDKNSLLGTFRATTTAPDPARPDNAAAVRDLDWVLYTPDGHFDASQAGRQLVRFRQEDRAHAMEQFDSTKLYTFELSELLRSGRLAEPARLDPPPPVAIDPPLRTDPALPETQLTISLGSADLKDVRLYHNGIPIPSGLEDKKPPFPDEFTVKVRLLPGTNQFYAMASHDGAFDSRSSEVEISYDGPVEPGRLHILALGVGNYDREKLQFAKRDAERLSAVLHGRRLTPGQQRGRSILLTDNQVNAEKITEAFTELGREVRGRPQDTVVLFLAGHTGVFDNERFCLLLPKYPFPADAPLMVAARGSNPPVAQGAKVAADDFLPYSALAVNLMRLEALNRLVIVDACQAESILSDPQVAAIQKWMEIGSRKVRTSYLMAARRGEPALEIKPLGHGLFTYTLLRGMREVTLGDEPQELVDLNLRPDADYDKDGIITTSELDAYVKEALPLIAAVFPKLVARGSVTEQLNQSHERGREDTPAASPNLEQSLRLQSSPVSFPLIQLR